MGPAVRAIHLLCATVWFGGALAMNLVVIPGVFAQPLALRRGIGRRVTLGFERVAIPSALITALSGLALGTIFGRIHGLVDLASPYGVGWVAAIIGVAAILATGARVSSPALRRLFDTEDLWIPTVDGSASGPLVNAMAAVRRGLLIELSGLGAVFVLMEALRYLPT